MLKTVIATAILGLGITGAYFTISNPIFSVNIESGTEEINSNIAGKPFVEDVNSLSSKGAYFPDLKNNKTDQYIGGIVEKIVTENPDISTMREENGSLKVPDADLVASELLTNAQLEFSKENIVPTIKDSDLNITENISIENIMAHAKQSDDISSKLAVFNFSNVQEFEKGVPMMVESYKTSISELYKLPVPKIMVGIHKTKIAYLSAELSLFERIANMKNDPVSAILASRNFIDLEKEFQDNLLLEMNKTLDQFKK